MKAFTGQGKPTERKFSERKLTEKKLAFQRKVAKHRTEREKEADHKSYSKEAKERLKNLNTEIIEVFKHIEVLRSYGFSENKITKWMSNDLSKKSSTMRSLFIKARTNKKRLGSSAIEEWPRAL
jgi:tRNA U34 5-carboxymethylaminomethyl modifying GTPase MnmE/TrmE